MKMWISNVANTGSGAILYQMVSAPFAPLPFVLILWTGL